MQSKAAASAKAKSRCRVHAWRTFSTQGTRANSASPCTQPRGMLVIMAHSKGSTSGTRAITKAGANAPFRSAQRLHDQNGRSASIEVTMGSAIHGAAPKRMKGAASRASSMGL